MEKEREHWVDYARAVACIAVVCFNVVYGMMDAGIECHIGLRIVKDTCDIFQLPLFFFLSGYIWTRLERGNAYVKYFLKKLVNYGVPYLVFSYVYLSINTLFSSLVNHTFSARDFLLVPIKPIAQYWFLFSLFLILAIVPIIERICRGNDKIVFIILLAVKILADSGYRIGYVDYYFSTYAVYFYFGVHISINRKGLLKAAHKKLNVFLVTVLSASFNAAFLAYRYLVGFEKIEKYLFFFLNGFTVYTIVLIMVTIFEKRSSKFLNKISRHTFQVYLLYTIFLAGIRIGLLRLGIENQIAHFIFGVVGGFGLPMLVAVISEKIGFTEVLFFPINTVMKWTKRRPDDVVVDFDYSNLTIYSGHFSESSRSKGAASGGAATALATEFVLDGGMVFGVLWTKDFKGAEYGYAETMDELGAFKGTKYVMPQKRVMTNKGYAPLYPFVEKCLNEGKDVLFFGLPCDVAALYRHCDTNGVNTDRLYTAEVICKGPTTDEAHKQFVENLESKYNSRMRGLLIRFKDKGTETPYIKATFANGKIIKKPFYGSDLWAALDNLPLLQCYDCPYKGAGHVGDLVLGSYKGMSKISEAYDENGVSIIVSRTKKGEKLVGLLKHKRFLLTKADTLAALSTNQMYFENRFKKPNRLKFENDLNARGLRYAARKNVKLPERVKLLSGFLGRK